MATPDKDMGVGISEALAKNLITFSEELGRTFLESVESFNAFESALGKLAQRNPSIHYWGGVDLAKPDAEDATIYSIVQDTRVVAVDDPGEWMDETLDDALSEPEPEPDPTRRPRRLIELK